MLDASEKIVYDTEAARAVRPGDVALLFRALSNVELYEEALRRYGIDYYLVGGRAFYAQQEIFDLLNLLRALCSPCDQVSLAGVLRSPFFGLLDETLFWLARHPDGLCGGLFADDLPAELDPRQRGPVESAAAVLRELRAMKDRVPIAQLIGEVLSRTGYDAILLAEFLGERKLANLRKLIEQARSFDRSGVFTLADFITQLSQFVARQPDEPLAATHPESSEVVRLMTIHQAKGLEFPVVVVPDVDRARRGSLTSVAFTPQLGPMVKYRDTRSGFDLHMLAEADEDRAELVRLLYVATTRAADYLILSAGLRELGSARGPWMELLQQRFDLSSGELRARLPDGYREPKVRVTSTEPPLDARASSARVRPGLGELVAEARQTAERGAGRVPQYLAPVPPDAAARRQYSFSRLTGALHERDLPRRADALPSDESWEPPAVDPVGLGTLVHAVLAEIDFADPGDVPAVVRRHAQRHLPEGEDGLDEPIELVRRFLASPRAAEVAAAEEVYRELEFLLAWPPGNGGEWDGRYLQGFIDCLYRDAAGAWHLVDYKTNRVTAATLAAVAADYEMQMLLYALAAESVLGRPPAELALSFLRPGLEHHFSWDDTSRRRVVELVDRALP
jgi:ATP-dependent helicase/nuclease subunit A